MFRTLVRSVGPYLTLSAMAVLVACADATPVAPEFENAIAENASAENAVTGLSEGWGHNRTSRQERRALATIRRVTARYHNINRAIADGFVLLHPCEERPDEGPVGIVYVNFDRLLDGRIDPRLPDALVYEPSKWEGGRPKLVGAEFAVPYSMWESQEPPKFFGAEFQPEDEFGVWGLHVWVWRHNPEGMYAEANPRVSCGAE